MRKAAWLCACLVPFFGFWMVGLTDIDEGFYGAVVRDMLRRGDWITPTLNGVPWFEKPILSYWVAMPPVALFGNEFGARMPSVVATLLTAWVWQWFLKRRGSPIANLMPIAYCGSLLVVGVGRMMLTDAPLVLCLTVALVGVCEVVEGKRFQTLADEADEDDFRRHEWLANENRGNAGDGDGQVGADSPFAELFERPI